MGSSAVEVLNFFSCLFIQLHKLPSQLWNSFLISKMFTTHWPNSIEITTSLYLIIAQVHSWVYKKRVWDLWQVQNNSFMSYFLLFFHELLFLNFLATTCVPDYGNIESWFYFQNIFFPSSLSMLEQDCWLIFWWCFYTISCAWHHTEHFTHVVFYWHRGTSPVLLKPKTTHEVSEILAYCNSRRLVLFNNLFLFFV